MLKRCLAFICFLLPLFSSAQNFTINQDRHGQIYIFEVANQQIKIIDRLPKWKLVGTEYLNEHSINACFFNGIDSMRKKYTFKFKVDKKDSVIRIVKKEKTKYTYSIVHTKYKIVTDIDSGLLSVYLNQSYQFNSNSSKIRKLTTFINCIPIDYDSSQNILLIEERYFSNEEVAFGRGIEKRIREISLDSGTVVWKKFVAESPKYSPDKSYLFYFNNYRKRVTYINRKTKVTTIDGHSLRGFWL